MQVPPQFFALNTLYSTPYTYKAFQKPLIRWWRGTQRIFQPQKFISSFFPYLHTLSEIELDQLVDGRKLLPSAKFVLIIVGCFDSEM